MFIIALETLAFGLNGARHHVARVIRAHMADRYPADPADAGGL